MSSEPLPRYNNMRSVQPEPSADASRCFHVLGSTAPKQQGSPMLMHFQGAPGTGPPTVDIQYSAIKCLEP